uniref:Uncharacterized protein n=1 Tax=virus sp. ctReX5 TaxID=2825818 RepID=A0A8S5RKV9_9VIRU|nr:MAG TPA: hypothetical protein [virus sp. ctReX5]
MLPLGIFLYPFLTCYRAVASCPAISPGAVVH